MIQNHHEYFKILQGILLVS